MSDDFQKKAIEEAQSLALSRQKEREIKKFKIENEHELLLRTKKEIENFKLLNFGENSEEYVNVIQSKMRKKFESAKKKMNFIDAFPALNGILPFYATEMILIACQTGNGKTTCSANIVHSLLLQGKKPLVITNEESSYDFGGKVAGLILNKRYGNLANSTPEYIEECIEVTGKVLRRVKVIDADYATDYNVDIKKITNSIEGLKFICEKLMEDLSKGIVVDCIIFDYYQRFDNSVKNPNLGKFECQAIAAQMLEDLRTSYPAPIVVFAQMKKDSEDAGLPFDERIQGRKIIANYATVIIEIFAKVEDSATIWVFHKGRSMDNRTGEELKCGWEKGKYVPYTTEFQNTVRQRKHDNIKTNIGGPGGQANKGTTEGAINGTTGSEQQVAEDAKKTNANSNNK